MTEVDEYRQRLLDSLEYQPGEYREAVMAIPEAWWRNAGAGAEGESVHRLVAHVRDNEVLMFLPRLRQIMLEDEPTLAAFAAYDWDDVHYQPNEAMSNLLDEFARARAESVYLLRRLDVEDWARMGFHPPTGKRTLMWWAERAYAHVRDHLAEISRVLDKSQTKPFIVPVGK